MVIKLPIIFFVRGFICKNNYILRIARKILADKDSTKGKNEIDKLEIKRLLMVKVLLLHLWSAYELSSDLSFNRPRIVVFQINSGPPNSTSAVHN